MCSLAASVNALPAAVKKMHQKALLLYSLKGIAIACEIVE